MDGGPSTAPSPELAKKKLRERKNYADPNFVNRGKPVSEKWKPVWIWLQSLNRKDVVEAADVTAWLVRNPDYSKEIKQHHSHGALVHYVQKCHQRLIFGRNYKGDGKKIRQALVDPKPAEHHITNEVRLPNGRFGSKASTGASEDGHVDVYELQWSPQLVQSLTSPSIKISDPGEGEASVSNAQLWREHWQFLLDGKKPGTKVEPGVEVKVEKPQGASPYPKRNKRPRSWYSPERPDKLAGMETGK